MSVKLFTINELMSLSSPFGSFCIKNAVFFGLKLCYKNCFIEKFNVSFTRCLGSFRIQIQTCKVKQLTPLNYK